MTGVRSANDHGALVELTYVDQNTRIEQQVGFMDPITPADVEFALHADAFVCVPITDYEVGQATLEYLKLWGSTQHLGSRRPWLRRSWRAAPASSARE